jgi:hypothetical protein
MVPGSHFSVSRRIEPSPNGISMNQQQCYLKAAELDSQNAKAFNNLGTTLTPDERINVDGRSMTKRDCYRKALEIEPGYTSAQKSLQKLDEAEAKVKFATTTATPSSAIALPPTTPTQHDANLAATVAMHGLQIASHTSRLDHVEQRLTSYHAVLTHLRDAVASQLNAPMPAGLPALPSNPHLLAYHITFRKSMGLLYASTQMISSGLIRHDDPHLATALRAIAQSIPLPLLGAAVGVLGGMVAFTANHQARARASQSQSRFGDHAAFTRLAHSVANTLCNNSAYQQRLLSLAPDDALANTAPTGNWRQRLGMDLLRPARLRPAATLLESQAESDVRHLSQALQADSNDQALQHATRQQHANQIGPMTQWMSHVVLDRHVSAVIAPLPPSGVTTITNPHHPDLVAELVEDGFLTRNTTRPDSPPSLRHLRIVRTSDKQQDVTAAAEAYYKRTEELGLR